MRRSLPKRRFLSVPFSPSRVGGIGSTARAVTYSRARGIARNDRRCHDERAHWRFRGCSPRLLTRRVPRVLHLRVNADAFHEPKKPLDLTNERTRSQFPHKVKVRKTLDAWPLTFKAGAEYDRVRNELNATAECRDAFLGGEFTLDVLHRAVEYSKTFDLGGVSRVSLRGRCDVGGLGAPLAGFVPGRRKKKHRRPLDDRPNRGDGWNASFGFTVEPSVRETSRGVRTELVGTTGGYDVSTEVPVSDLVSAEICGHLTLPMPRAEFVAHSGGGGRLSVGRGAIQAHVAQINAVVNL